MSEDADQTTTETHVTTDEDESEYDQRLARLALPKDPTTLDESATLPNTETPVQAKEIITPKIDKLQTITELLEKLKLPHTTTVGDIKEQLINLINSAQSSPMDLRYMTAWKTIEKLEEYLGKLEDVDDVFSIEKHLENDASFVNRMEVMSEQAMEAAAKLGIGQIEKSFGTVYANKVKSLKSAKGLISKEGIETIMMEAITNPSYAIKLAQMLIQERFSRLGKVSIFNKSPSEQITKQANDFLAVLSQYISSIAEIRNTEVVIQNAVMEIPAGMSPVWGLHLLRHREKNMTEELANQLNLRGKVSIVLIGEIQKIEQFISDDLTLDFSNENLRSKTKELLEADKADIDSYLSLIYGAYLRKTSKYHKIDSKKLQNFEDSLVKYEKFLREIQRAKDNIKRRKNLAIQSIAGKRMRVDDTDSEYLAPIIIGDFFANEDIIVDIDKLDLNFESFAVSLGINLGETSLFDEFLDGLDIDLEQIEKVEVIVEDMQEIQTYIAITNSSLGSRLVLSDYDFNLQNTLAGILQRINELKIDPEEKEKLKSQVQQQFNQFNEIINFNRQNDVKGKFEDFNTLSINDDINKIKEKLTKLEALINDLYYEETFQTIFVNTQDSFFQSVLNNFDVTIKNILLQLQIYSSNIVLDEQTKGRVNKLKDSYSKFVRIKSNSLDLLSLIKKTPQTLPELENDLKKLQRLKVLPGLIEASKEEFGGSQEEFRQGLLVTLNDIIEIFEKRFENRKLEIIDEFIETVGFEIEQNQNPSVEEIDYYLQYIFNELSKFENIQEGSAPEEDIKLKMLDKLRELEELQLKVINAFINNSELNTDISKIDFYLNFLSKIIRNLSQKKENLDPNNPRYYDLVKLYNQLEDQKSKVKQQAA